MVGLIKIRAGHATPPVGFNLVRIGGGGWCTQVQFSNDGTAICRNDTYGAYVRGPSDTEWRQVFTTSSFTLGTDSGNATSNNDLLYNPVGIYEAVISRSNSSVMYIMSYHKLDNGVYVYRSINGGASWTRTAKSEINHSSDAFTIYSYRMNGPFMDIHPTDPNTVVIGTIQDGAFYTTDGGANWSAISGILNPTTVGPGMFVQFDPTNGETVYIASDGRGVYQSTTGPDGTFSLTSSGPTTFQFLGHDLHSRLWACMRSGTHALWRFASGSWSNINAGSQSSRPHSLVSDDGDSNNLYAQMDSGHLITSTNAGTNWTDPINLSVSPRDIPVGEPTWLENTNEDYMSAGISAWDPLNNRVTFPCGIGPFYTTAPGASTTWQAYAKGIEQMVCTKIISPPGDGRVPVASFWDRSVFRIDNPEVHPTNHGFNYTQAIAHCFDIDYASADPDTIIGYTANSVSQFGVSDDGGATWALVTNPASLAGGGSVAAASATNFCQVSADSGARMRFTTNGGSSWTLSTMTGVPTSGETGWGLSSIEDRHILCADRVDANTFYAYNNGANGDTSFAGVWKSTDSGANWTKVFAGRMNVVADSGLHYAYNAHNAHLEAAPTNAGVLFYTTGNVDGSTDSKFMRSTNAGTDWAAVPNVLEAKKFGFGKPASGTVPVLYIVGWVSGVYGVWMSEDCLAGTPAWTNLGTYPLGRSDVVTSVCGDSNRYKRVFIGYRGSSVIYGDFA